MENYIVINGKKAELTEEQLKALGIEVEKKSPFSRAKKGEKYHFISWNGNVKTDTEMGTDGDNACFEKANYCTDKELLQQQAYKETLNRLLWRYSMEHDGDKIDWYGRNTPKWCVVYNYSRNEFEVSSFLTCSSIPIVVFYEEQTAENAIKEIVEPFLAEHPDFKW